MKKSLLCGMLLCLSIVAFGQRSMEWYSYWGSNVSGSQIDPQRMIVDDEGNIYVAALFGGNKVAVESKTLSSNSSADKGDAVIVKMSPAKVVLWTYEVVNAGSATVADLAIDSQGNIFVTGAFNNSIKAVGGTMKPDDLYEFGQTSVYVIKLSKDGQLQASWQISASDGAKAGSLVIDSKDNVIVAGLLDGDAMFVADGAAEGDMQNTAQMFVAKYANDGTPIWHKFRNDEGAVSVYGRPYLAVDAKDNIYVGSSINGSTTIKDDAVVATFSNAFLIAMNANGEEQWYHVIEGDESDEAAGIAVSPIGQVALAVNHHSGELRLDDLSDIFNNGYQFNVEFQHTAIFAFTLAGDFKWFYNWGYSNYNADPSKGGSDAICYALRCTDEGVWYAAGMMTGRFGGSRLDEDIRTLPAGKNSGVETIDNQWLQHNTNGGHDCYLITLTREGKLANAIRPGGPQYEDGIDVALSPDKKSLYLLMQINVRDNVPYTCPDNIFDSWTDLYAPANWESRKGNYTLLNVLCPENNGSSTNYGKDYKGIFASSMLVKYAMPEINPNNLPYFKVDEPYAASISLANAQGKVRMFPLGQSGDVTFDGENISGTFDTDVPRFAGVLAIDSTALPGKITYYEYDKDTHFSIRSNPRNCRYMAITVGEIEEAIEMTQLDASVYPTICSGNLNIRCNEANYTVNMYTMDGRMIFSNDNVAVITVGGLLPQGQYMVEVRSGNLRNTTSIFVK